MGDDENPNARLLALSDGVVAVAITLLVLDLRLPEGYGEFSDPQLWSALLDLWPRVLAYLISFAVIGVYWINHHAKFRRIVGTDQRLMMINLVFLLFISVVPFTTGIIAENSGAVGTAVYAIGMVACGLSLTWLWAYADRAGLVDPQLQQRERRRLLLTTLLSSGVFALSVPLAFANSDAAKYIWIGIFVVNMVFRIIGRSGGDKARETPHET